MRNKNKGNPLLDAYAKQLKAAYTQQLEINTEFDYIAFMRVINAEFQVGPGRAGRLFENFLAEKMGIANEILQDSEADKEIIYTKRNLALCLKEIFGPEGWKKYRNFFTLTKEYWD